MQRSPGRVPEGIDADRLCNFKQRERERRRHTLSALERRDLLRLWKTRSRASRLRERIG